MTDMLRRATVMDTGVSDSGRNAALFQGLQADLAVITGHAILKDIVSADPIGIKGHTESGSKRKGKTAMAKGGARDAFHPDKLKAALEDANFYDCSGNFFWINILACTSPDTPILENDVLNLQKQFSKNPHPARIYWRSHWTMMR